MRLADAQQHENWKPTRAPDPRKVATHLVDDFDCVPFSALCRPQLQKRAFDCHRQSQHSVSLPEAGADLEPPMSYAHHKTHMGSKIPTRQAQSLACRHPARAWGLGVLVLGSQDNRVKVLFSSRREALPVDFSLGASACFQFALLHQPFANASCLP